MYNTEPALPNGSAGSFCFYGVFVRPLYINTQELEFPNMKSVLFSGKNLPHVNFNVRYASGTGTEVNYNTP